MKERKDIYKLPAGDTTLEWYAKAIAKMKTRPSSDPTSWAYQAAIHGIVTNPTENQYWRQFAPFPPSSETKLFWIQCQHRSWFFVSWHRMYLAYFEQIVAQTIVDIGGPDGWALPFWNYSDSSNPKALDMPTPFTTPANASNPLWMPNRRDTLRKSSVSLINLKMKTFTSTDMNIGFGGPVTKFNHSGGANGGLESLPHNAVHGDIGGAMGSLATAALDPIFWIHHSNVDRLWQVWLNQGERANSNDPRWLNFEFNFHNSNKVAVTMKSSQVLDTRTVLSGYTFQGVPSGLPSQNLTKSSDTLELPLEIVAASNAAHKLTEKSSNISLQLKGSSNNLKSFTSKAINESISTPKKMMLQFENIKGKTVSPNQAVYINVPNDDGTANSHLAGVISLFGLEESSVVNEHNSGSGLIEAVEITDLIDELRKHSNWDENNIHVEIRPEHDMDDNAEVTIGRISLYTE